MERQMLHLREVNAFYRANQLYHYQQYCCFYFAWTTNSRTSPRLVLFATKRQQGFQAPRRDYRWKPRSLQTVQNERAHQSVTSMIRNFLKVSPSIHDSVDRHTRATPEAKFRSFLPRAGSREQFYPETRARRFALPFL